MTETKFIIARKYGKIKRLKCPTSYSHFYFARDNGIDYDTQVLETGFLIDGQILIETCRDKEHLSRHDIKRKNNIIDLNYYNNKRVLRAREVESLYQYKYAGLREGD